MKDIRLEVSARVYKILLDFKNNAGIRTFGIKSRHEGTKQILTIYTDCPGYVIGYHVERLERLLSNIREDSHDSNIEIEIEELNFFLTMENEKYSDEEQLEFMRDYMMSHGF